MTAAARRGHGEGSLYRDAVNGTWVGAISLGWRPDGSRIRRKVTGRTKTEVREKLKRLQAEADAGLKTSASYTVAKAVDDWAAEALDGLAAKTVRSHVDLLRPVMMLIGQVPLPDLTAQAAAGRRSGVLRVNAVHRDVRFTKAMTADVEAEIAAQAGWPGLRLQRSGRPGPSDRRRSCPSARREPCTPLIA
jgi:hypothetical protein